MIHSYFLLTNKKYFTTNNMSSLNSPVLKQIFTSCIGSVEDFFTRDVEVDVPLSAEEQIEKVKSRYHLSQQQIDAFKDTFDQLDKDKNGKNDVYIFVYMYIFYILCIVEVIFDDWYSHDLLTHDVDFKVHWISEN
jgi:hypothetical protein